MLKHKFTSYTNTNLRTVIKYLKCNKTWVFFFLLSHLIQLLLLCSVLLLNKALFVRQSVHPYSAIFTVGRFVVCGRSCIIFSKQAGRLSHLPLAGACSTGKIYPLRIWCHHLSIDLLRALWMAVSMWSTVLQTGQGKRCPHGPRNLSWAVYISTRTVRGIQKWLWKSSSVCEWYGYYLQIIKHCFLEH